MNRRFGGKIKKILLAGTAAALIAPLSMLPYAETASAAATTVYVNGRLASGEVLVRKGLTYLTLTDLQGLGNYTFRYSKTWRTITITGGSGGDRYVLTLGSREARRNGTSITLAAAPLSYENKTMIPVRVAAELFDADLVWDQNSGRVMLTKNTDSGNSQTSPTRPSRPPVSPPGPSGPTVPKPPTPPSVR